DSMDPSPFHEKDLDRNAEEYIVSSARELPGHAPAALVVVLDEPRPDAADLLRAAVRVHFERRALLARRPRRQLLRRGWIGRALRIPVCAAVIFGGSLLARVTQDPIGGTLLRESLLIGGWVGMWRPMEILLYDWWGLRNERRVYDRLSAVKVQVVETGARAA